MRRRSVRLSAGGKGAATLMLVNITPRFRCGVGVSEERDAVGKQHESNRVEADNKGGSSLALSSAEDGSENLK